MYYMYIFIIFLPVVVFFYIYDIELNRENIRWFFWGGEELVIILTL